MYRTSHWRWNIDMNMDHFIYKVVMELIGAAEQKRNKVKCSLMAKQRLHKLQ
ncbi:hypothetical protein CIPAW_05G136300 [Carya illinoinensis]|uniref:Uncharacterized protein n=1 Tax=Carya illinoinensis TaxID=32201 RepID=A0A8T1QJA2_CARIL|nr:hypothetical protein CIPAW_05G136300 [Carya illinoinensis]